MAPATISPKTRPFDPGSSAANKQWNSETKRAYQGAKSKPLPARTFDVGTSRRKLP